MQQISLKNTRSSSRRISADTLQFHITFVLWCVFICNVVQAQQLPEQQLQQQQYKFNQLKFQMQQQQKQQFDYQQQMQQQYRQQYEQQQEQLRQLQQEQQQSQTAAHNQSPFHALLPITLPLKQQQQLTHHKQQDENVNSPTISTNTQLLQTSASLVVASGQKEYYDSASDVQATIKRRAGNRKRKRRPQIVTPEIGENYNKNISTRNISTGVKRRKPISYQEDKPLEQPQKTDLPLTEHDKSNRRVKPTAEVTTTGSVKSELKNLLKNSVGNMSLSELLQQKNLSLDDLLKGKQNALLALQSTASAPTTLTKTGYNVRRLPTVPTLSEVMNKPNITLNSTENNNNNNNDANTKNKLKFPALQRLKLFGTSSRMTSLTTATTTTTTSTPTIIVSSSTTTRLPLYKKRLQQRPTLKPPALFKPILTSTNTNKALEENVKILEETDVDVPEHEVEHQKDIIISTTKTTTTSTTEIPSTIITKTTTTTTTTAPTASSTTTTTSIIMPSISTSVAIKEPIASRVNYISLHNKEQNNDNESNEDINVQAENEHLEEQHNLKTNSIEHDEVSTTTTHANYADNISNEAEDDDDDLENFFVEAKQDVTKPSINITPRIDFVATKKAKNRYNEFNDGVDDRTDILELIEDRRNGNRLFKILEQRNMTLDELIEHRKRGSSQLHLKTIVENQAGLFPGQKIILQDNMDIVTAFENFPHFNLMNLKSVRPDDIKTDSQGASYFTSIIDIEPTDEVYKDGASGETGDNTNRAEKGVEFFPSWKTLALASLSRKPVKNAAAQRNPFYLPPTKLLLDNVSQDLDDVDSQENSNNQNIADIKEKVKVPTAVVEDENVVEAIENEVARAHDLLDLELSGHGFKRSPAAAASLSHRLAPNQYSQMPAGIRSAIVASAAIVLTSLATFMVIFVVCRWKQHKRRKSSYMKTYNAMKSKMPALSIHSRGSSMRHMDEIMSGIATITQSPTQQLQRQNDLLFPRHNHNESTTPISATTAASVRTNGSLLGNFVGLRKQGLDTTLDKCNKNRKTHHHHHHHGFNCTTTTTTTGSTNSLALSLQSATHNDINTTTRKINSMDTMDPNSPEVQEYLFDALRNSF